MSLRLDKKNVRLLLILALIYLVVVVIIVTYIWIPKDKDKADFKYHEYSQSELDSMVKSKYFDEISENLMLRNATTLYNMTSEYFLQANNLDIDSFGKYLLNNGYYSSNMISDSYIAYKSGTDMIYVLKYTINGVEKIITAIESYPNKYTLSFGNVIYDEQVDKHYMADEEGINFNIDRKIKNINTLGYDIEITNNNDGNVLFNFVDVTKIQLVTDDNKTFNMNSTEMAGTDKALSKGSSVKKELIFNIPCNEQPNVKYLVFKGVNISGKTQEVRVELY